MYKREYRKQNAVIRPATNQQKLEVKSQNRNEVPKMQSYVTNRIGMEKKKTSCLV